MSAATRDRKLKGWARAVKGVLASDEGRGSASSSWPGLTRPSTSYFLVASETWTPGSSPGTTTAESPR